jgi:chromate transporter
MDAPRLPPPAARVTIRELFTQFLVVGMSGFGGVLPFARRMVVERCGWLSEQEFTEVLSLAQFLPGPNIVNVAIIIGRRFQGPVGAMAAAAGLLLLPLVVVLLLATAYVRFAQIDAVRGAADGVSAAASGLVLAMGFRMARTIARSRWQPVVCAVAFVAIGIARFPLLWDLAALVPLAVAIAWWRRA